MDSWRQYVDHYSPMSYFFIRKHSDKLLIDDTREGAIDLLSKYVDMIDSSGKMVPLYCHIIYDKLALCASLDN